MKKAKSEPKYIYLGLIPEQRVVRVPLWDLPEITKRFEQGWVTSTKDAWNRFQEGSKMIFYPVKSKNSDIMMLSQVVYPPSVIKLMSIQNRLKSKLKSKK